MASWANGVTIDYTFYETPTTHKQNENISSFVDYNIYKNANFFIKMEILTLLFVKRKSFRISEIIQHLKNVIAGMTQEKRSLYNKIKLQIVVYSFMAQLRNSNFIYYKWIRNNKNGCDFYYLYKYKNNFDEFFKFDLFNNKRFVRYIEKNFQMLSMKTFTNLNKLLLCIKQHQPITIKDIHNFCKIYNGISQYNKNILVILRKTGIVIKKKISLHCYYYIKGDLFYE